MRELFALGHTDYQRTVRVSVQERLVKQEASRELVKHLGSELSAWKLRLEEVSNEHPWLRFYSTHEAQRLHSILRDLSTDNALLQLVLMLLPLFERTAEIFARLRDAIAHARTHTLAIVRVHAAIARWRQWQGKSPMKEHWPATVGFFLKLIQDIMHHQLPLRPATAAPVQWGGVHVHTVEPKSDALILLLHRIFNRLPEPFEVLWCSSSVDLRSMERFLDQAKHYTSGGSAPGRCFALVQVETLTPTVQQALLRHLLASRDMPGQNLHCVQSAATALQAAPWIHHHKETTTSSREETAQQLRAWAVDGQHISAVRYVTGPSGSGKTHLIKKEVAAWEASSRATCVVSITEAFSIDAVALQLHEAVLKHGGTARLGLCFHLNLGKFRAQELQQWKSLMETINRFFFSLLVRASHEAHTQTARASPTPTHAICLTLSPISQILRSVEDSNGFVFNVPPGCSWDVLVEIPDRNGHLDEPVADALSQGEGLWQELPVIACVGQLIHPSALFDLDDETRLVCKYLHADKEKTIDELYSGRGGTAEKVRESL